LGELNGAGIEADKFSEELDVVVLVGSAVDITNWVSSTSSSDFVVPSGLDQRVCCLKTREHVLYTRACITCI